MTNLLNRVAFTIGGLDIYWYGLIMAFSILLAFLLVLWYCKKKGHGTDFAFELLLATVIPGIACARLFSVLLEPGTGIQDYFSFRDGGLSIIGAVTGGVIGVALLCVIRKKNFFDLADIVVPVLIMAQGIGRWGNFANQELYGQAVTNPSMQWFPFAVFIDSEGGWFQALFFYESVLDILGFVLLTVLLLKVKKRMLPTATYFAYYGLVRTCLEPLRDETYILRAGKLPFSQIMSIVMLVAGLSMLVYLLVEFIIKKKKGKVAGANAIQTQVAPQNAEIEIKSEPKKEEGE